jgi:hypothetical protein
MFLASDTVYSQNNADWKAINDLIDKYSALEDSGDMMSQAKLMAADRVWIAELGGRMTNQIMNMELQQAGFDEAKMSVPGVKWFTDARDRLIKFYGEGSVAVASFYWYRSFVLPADTPPEKVKLLNPVQPATFTLVLEKKSGDWKIVHTHSSPLGYPPADNN